MWSQVQNQHQDSITRVYNSAVFKKIHKSISPAEMISLHNSRFIWKRYGHLQTVIGHCEDFWVKYRLPKKETQIFQISIQKDPLFGRNTDVYIGTTFVYTAMVMVYVHIIILSFLAK